MSQPESRPVRLALGRHTFEIGRRDNGTRQSSVWTWLGVGFDRLLKFTGRHIADMQ